MLRAWPVRPRLAKNATTGAARDDARGLQGHQLGIARPQPDRVERAVRHSASLASALTAAAAMALPPLRPCTIRNGTRPSAASAALDFRGADEADRHADHRGRVRGAGVEQFEQPEQRSRRVADGDERAFHPLAPQREGGGRTRVADAPGDFGHLWRVQRADHLVRGGQPGTRDAVRDHLRVAQDRPTSKQRRRAASAKPG